MLGHVEIISYISSIIRDDMRDKIYFGLSVVCVIGVVLLIPSIIKGLFWILLQMMLYPLTAIIIIGNLFMWNYLYIRFTANKLKKKTK